MIVVQVFSNLDEFMRFAEKQKTSLFDVLISYYCPYALTIFEQLSGMIALMSLLFVIAWLYRTNEFTALMAAGVTKWRVVRPLIFASIAVVLLAAGIREIAIPKYQDQLERNPQDLTGEVGRAVKPKFDPRAQVLITGRYILPINQKIIEPWLDVHKGPLSKACGPQISAATATFEEGKDGKPSGFLMQAVKQPARIDQIDSVYMLDGSPLLLTRKDTDWLNPGECFLASEIDYEQMRGGNSWKRFASTNELMAHLRSGELHSENDLQIQIHQRILRPLVDWTLLLLGMPVLLSRPDRHMFWVAGACLMLVSGFTVVVLGLAALGATGYFLSPAMAIWLPLVVFLPWGWMKTAQAMNS
jgi:lipopolysaccharide export system permease protein